MTPSCRPWCLNLSYASSAAYRSVSVSVLERVGPMAYPHIVEFNEAFVTPLTRGYRLDITELLEFATNFVVINELA